MDEFLKSLRSTNAIYRQCRQQSIAKTDVDFSSLKIRDKLH